MYFAPIFNFGDYHGGPLCTSEDAEQLMNALMEDNLPPHLVERRRADSQAPETLMAVKQFIVPNQSSF